MKTNKKSIVVIAGIGITGVFMAILSPFWLMFFVMMILGGNSPSATELVNQIGEPLGIHEVWNEKGLFEVKVCSVREIPLDSLLTDYDDPAGYPPNDSEYIMTGGEIEQYKQNGLKAVEVIFEFNNINYAGFVDQYADAPYSAGMLLKADAAGHNEYGWRSGMVPLDCLFPNSRLCYGPDQNTVRKGETSGLKRQVLLANEDVSRIKLRFTVPKESDWDGSFDTIDHLEDAGNKIYEKHFYCNIS